MGGEGSKNVPGNVASPGVSTLASINWNFVSPNQTPFLQFAPRDADHATDVALSPITLLVDHVAVDLFVFRLVQKNPH